MEKVSKKKGKEEKPDVRGKFSGRIGYVLAVAGSAVGLGNIWRFPYLAAKYGGGMFLLVYLILMLTFGYVMIMSETTLGRMTKKSPVGAFGTFGKKKSLKFGGWINAVIPMLIVPYYSVIGGWVLKYLFEYLRGNSETLAKDGCAVNPNKTGDLDSQGIGKLLLRLALPTITAQLVNALYNMVDRIYIGHIPVVGKTALTGVGVCLSLIMIISAFAALTAMGGATRASILLGKGQRDTAERILGNCVTGSVVVGLVLTAVFLSFSRPLLLAFGASEETIVYAVQYMKIYALGTVFVELALGLNAFITAQGFASVAMISVLIGAVANMILDAVLILVFDMGVAGAALATIISQGLSALWVVRFLLGRKTGLRIKKENLRLDWKLYAPCLALGMSPFVMQSTEGVISVCFNASLQKYGGDLAVGAMTILSSVMHAAVSQIPGFGSLAGTLSAALAVVVVTGTLATSVFSQPRVQYQMARDGLWFPKFGEIHPKYKTPAFSIVVQCALAIFFIFVSNISEILGYFTLTISLRSIIGYLVVFKYHKRDDYHPTYHMPCWRVLSIALAIMAFIMFLGTLSWAPKASWAFIAIALVTGYIGYRYFESHYGLKVKSETKQDFGDKE